MKIERIRLDDDGSIVATIDCDIEALTWLESYLPVKDEASKRISIAIGNILRGTRNDGSRESYCDN